MHKTQSKKNLFELFSKPKRRNSIFEIELQDFTLSVWANLRIKMNFEIWDFFQFEEIDSLKFCLKFPTLSFESIFKDLQRFVHLSNVCLSFCFWKQILKKKKKKNECNWIKLLEEQDLHLRMAKFIGKWLNEQKMKWNRKKKKIQHVKLEFFYRNCLWLPMLFERLFVNILNRFFEFLKNKIIIILLFYYHYFIIFYSFLDTNRAGTAFLVNHNSQTLLLTALHVFGPAGGKKQTQT